MDDFINAEKCREAVLTYLQEKYNDTFSVVRGYQEFDGRNGLYLRLICCSATYKDEEFIAMCYAEEARSDVRVSIEGKIFALADEYAQVLIQNEVLQQLPHAENAVVRCRVRFPIDQPTPADLLLGAAHCLGSAVQGASLTIFIVAKDNPAVQALRAAAEDLTVQYAPYAGYICLAEKSEFDEAEIRLAYTAHQHNFDDFLVKSDFADRLAVTLYKAKTRTLNRRMIKE